MSEPTFCPACGFDVRTDDDGCCLVCGATATGQAVGKLAEFIAAAGALRVFDSPTLRDRFDAAAKALGVKP